MVKLELADVEALATATFLSPIAPDKTISAKATTARDLYIQPSGRKTNPEAVYVHPFPNGTELLPCV
jgi:hypothetical protein